MQSVSLDNKTYVSRNEHFPRWRKVLPTWRFYPTFIGIVIRAGMCAKKGLYGDEDWFESSLEVIRALESVGVTLEATGLEYLTEKDGPVIFIGNHLSVLETVVLPGLIRPYKPITYVVKQSLLEYPVFKHVMHSRNPIAVTRTNPRQDLKIVLEEGLDRLSKGISVIIFPQTTRAAFDPQQFSTIGIKLAKKAGVPVIPLALLTDAWGNGPWLKDFGRINPNRRVYFSFGKPLMVAGKGNDEHQQIISFIEEHLRIWQE